MIAHVSPHRYDHARLHIERIQSGKSKLGIGYDHSRYRVVPGTTVRLTDEVWHDCSTSIPTPRSHNLRVRGVWNDHTPTEPVIILGLTVGYPIPMEPVVSYPVHIESGTSIPIFKCLA